MNISKNIAAIYLSSHLHTTLTIDFIGGARSSEVAFESKAKQNEVFEVKEYAHDLLKRHFAPLLHLSLSKWILKQSEEIQ